MNWEWARLVGGIIGAYLCVKYGILGCHFVKGEAIGNWIQGYTASNPGLFLVFLFGIGLTCLVHSSSLIMWSLIPLVASGALPPVTAIAVVLGANIGTCIDGVMAAGVFQSVASWKVAFSHIAFNVLGNLILFPLFLMFKKYLV